MKTAKQVRSAKTRAMCTTTKPRREAGSAAVEFALVLPILLVLLFGIINFGFIFATQISLNSSARDGARAGVVRPLGGAAKTCDKIADMARGGAGTLGLTNTDAIKVTVTNPDLTSCTWGSNVATTPSAIPMCATSGQLFVVLEYTVVSPVPLVPPSSVNLKATGAFQCEYS